MLQACRLLIRRQFNMHHLITRMKSSEWQKVISEAEKVVGYPTSFMYLRCLLSDEIADVAMHVRKLITTKHPLLKTARGLVYGDKNGIQIRGLIVLLFSKASMIDYNTHNSLHSNTVSGIQERHRTLAEITDMIHTAYLIHRGIVNINEFKPSDGTVSDMEFGNKISILSGDFLLANACTSLAQLENTKVVEIVSSAISDLSHAEFLLDSVNKSESNLTDWLKYSYYSSCSLLAKSCQSSLLLINQSPQRQQIAFNFGLNIAYALQIQTANKNTQEMGHLSTELTDLHHSYINSARQCLDEFADSTAKTALSNICSAISLDNALTV